MTVVLAFRNEVSIPAAHDGTPGGKASESRLLDQTLPEVEVADVGLRVAEGG